MLPLSLQIKGLRQGAILDIGKGGENGKIRYHRYASAIEVTDLANAGKRGKRCDQFTLYDIDFVSRNYNKSENIKKVFQNIMKFLRNLDTLNYKQALDWATLIEKDASQRKIETIKPKLSKTQLMAHKVLPGGSAPIKFANEHMSVSVDLNTFTISDLTDQFNMPRCINTSRGGKDGPRKLYQWLSQNLEKAKKMTYHELTDMLDKLGVKSHSYCAMD